MKKLKKCRIVVCLIIPVFAFLLFSCGGKEYPKDNIVKSELKTLRTAVKKAYNDSITESIKLKIFESYVNDLISKWEQNAPDEVIEKIEILKAGESISSAAATEDVMEMGVFAKGTCKELMNTLGNAYLIRHGDIERIFGAKDFTAGKNAGKAFYAIGEPAIPALILSLYLSFDDEVEEFGAYRKNNAEIILSQLTGKDFGSEPAKWIKWYLTTQDNIVISEVAQSEEVERESTEKESNDYFDNEFLWALIVGAVIVIFFSFKKKKRKNQK